MSACAKRPYRQPECFTGNQTPMSACAKRPYRQPECFTGNQTR